MSNCFNPDYFSQEGVQKLNQDFQAGVPYKHIIMDNFIKADLADELYDNFPSVDLLDKHYKGLNENKSEGANFEAFHPTFKVIKEGLATPEFAQWISKISEIDELFVTDDNLGTGIHQGVDGSFLDIHIDFNIHVDRDVHRRLNLLIYLNKHWKESYGGDLEMWDAQMTKCVKKVAPSFNRAVIFETNEISYHGYSKISLPEGESRKSIYSYFYTKLREDAVNYHDTVFRAKPEDSAMKKIGTNLKENLKNFAKTNLKKIGIKI